MIKTIIEEMREQATKLSVQSLEDNSRLAPGQVATMLRMYIIKLEKETK